MKPTSTCLLILMMFFFLVSSCRKNIGPTQHAKNCKETQMIGLTYVGKENTIIPLHSDNFWIYDDTLYNWQEMKLQLLSDNFIIYIQSFTLLDAKFILSFNRFISPVTVIGDSICTAERTPEFEKPDCYEFRPYLFRVTDTVFLNKENSSFICPANGQISTKLGMLGYNYVYCNEKSFIQYINDTIGVIRYEIMQSETQMVRSYTLNNYEIVK